MRDEAMDRSASLLVGTVGGCGPSRAAGEDIDHRDHAQPRGPRARALSDVAGEPRSARAVGHAGALAGARRRGGGLMRALWLVLLCSLPLPGFAQTPSAEAIERVERMTPQQRAAL